MNYSKIFFTLALVLLIDRSQGESFESMANRMASHSGTPTISVAELKKALGKDAPILIDTRGQNEFNTSRIKGAQLWTDNLLSQLRPDQTVVVYCSIGYRSGKTGEKLLKKGLKVFNLYGGIFHWFNQGNPIIDSKGIPTEKIHGYNKKWSQWISRPSAQVVY